MVDRMSYVLKWTFVAFASAFWLVFGTSWLVLVLMRALTIFSVTFMYRMFTDQGPTSLPAQMYDVTDLWVRGFRNAYASVFGQVQPSVLEVRNGRLALEVLGTLFFWYGFLLVYAHERVIPAFGRLTHEFWELVRGATLFWPFLVVAAIAFVGGLIVGAKYHAPIIEFYNEGKPQGTTAQ